MSSLLTKIENKLGMGHHDTTTTNTHTTNTHTANTNVTSTPGSSMTGGASHMGREQMATGTHGASTESGAAMNQTAVSGSSTGANSITGQHVGVGSQMRAEADSHLHHNHHATGVAHNQGAVAGGVATQHVQDEAYVTRAEERLVVGKETVGAGVAQLHKYVTTEHVGTAVPVLKERAVVEREMIPAGERVGAIGANAFQEQHIAVALTNEVAVGRKEEVPIERVRLRKEVEVGEQLVEADLRKEHIEVTETAASGVGMNAEKRLDDAAMANRNNAQMRQ